MRIRRIIGSVSWAAVEASSLILLSFATLLLLARWIGPADFGRASAVIAVVQLANILVEQLFSEVLIQRSSLRQDHIDAAFWTALAAAVALIAGAGLFFAVVPDSRSLLLFAASATLLPSAYVGVQSALLRRRFDFRALAIRSFAGRLVGAAAALAVAGLGGGAWSLIVQQLLAAVIGALTLWWCSSERIGTYARWVALKELLGFSSVALASEAMIVAAPKLFQVVASYMLGAVAFGYFSVAFRIVDTLRELIGHVASNVSLPYFSRSQNDGEMLKRQFMFSTSLVSLVAMPTFVGLAVCSDLVVVAVLGEQWLGSATQVSILAGSAAVCSAATFCYSIFSALGRPSLGLLPRGFVDLAVTLSLLLVLGGRGELAIAQVWAFRNIVSSALALVMCLSVLRIRWADFLVNLAWPALVAAVFALALALADAALASLPLTAVEKIVVLGSSAGALLTVVAAATHWRVLKAALGENRI